MERDSVTKNLTKKCVSTVWLSQVARVTYPPHRSIISNTEILEQDANLSTHLLLITPPQEGCFKFDSFISSISLVVHPWLKIIGSEETSKNWLSGTCPAKVCNVEAKLI